VYADADLSQEGTTSRWGVIPDTRNDPERDLHLKDVHRFLVDVCTETNQQGTNHFERNWKVLVTPNISRNKQVINKKTNRNMSSDLMRDGHGLEKNEARLIANELGFSLTWFMKIRKDLYAKARRLGATPKWKDMIEGVMSDQGWYRESGEFPAKKLGTLGLEDQNKDYDSEVMWAI
jgi:hypothetical protein